MSERATPSVAQVGLIGLFVTALVTAQVTASKLLGFELPFALPLAGEMLVLPGAALAYALTFFASDCYSELYGRTAATVVVNVGFVMNFVLLVLVWSTIAAPPAPPQAQSVDLAATLQSAIHRPRRILSAGEQSDPGPAHTIGLSAANKSLSVAVWLLDEFLGRTRAGEIRRQPDADDTDDERGGDVNRKSCAGFQREGIDRQRPEVDLADVERLVQLCAFEEVAREPADDESDRHGAEGEVDVRGPHP